MNEYEIKNRIRNAIILLTSGHRFKVGDLTLGAKEKRHLSVTGYTLYWDLKNLTRQKALIELSEIKDIFKEMLAISPELVDFVKNRKIVYYLADDYGSGELEICREENDEVKWTGILKE